MFNMENDYTQFRITLLSIWIVLEQQGHILGLSPGFYSPSTRVLYS